MSKFDTIRPLLRPKPPMDVAVEKKFGEEWLARLGKSNELTDAARASSNSSRDDPARSGQTAWWSVAGRCALALSTQLVSVCRKCRSSWLGGEAHRGGALRCIDVMCS
jgi:hypothetical protein